VAEKYLIRNGPEAVTYDVRREGDAIFVRRQGSEHWREAALERIGESRLYLVMLDSEPLELYLERRRGGAVVTVGRHTFNYDVAPWRPGSGQPSRSAAGPSGIVRVTAPMTGSVVETRCSPGDRVTAGQVLMVIESMKMNNELRSPAAGDVQAVLVSAGQRVKAGDLLVSLQA
jgi:biotin carboxyl carrier protein